MSTLDTRTLAQYIDHTNLRPDAKASEISKLCDEALEYKFRSVCVEKKWLGLVVPPLTGSGVMAITVVSFPHGTDSPDQKAEETRLALDSGAEEIDMVLNRNLLKTKNYAGLFKDIQAVAQSANSAPVKVILETSELTDEEKILACGIAHAAGARFVKTSTGFSKSGATESDVRLMRRMVGETMGVKASGGIRTLAETLRMIRAGANRIGCSSSVAILKEIGEK